VSTGGSGGNAGGGATGTGGAAGAPAVAATPPMGWNSWNTFGCSPSESLIKGVADTFVSSGMAAVGYQYVNIDDCWMNGRDSSGNLQWDTSKFPSGIPALATYVHGKGLKLGIYESPNATTCAGKTGGAGHESQDAKTFASWGVDYLKYDNCGGSLTSFTTMHTALVATNRPIFYSINPVYGQGSCVPPNCSVDELKICNMWRIGFDINASWSSFTGLIDIDKPLAQYAAPGHWNDPDMLEVGRGMSADEDRSHFGMWAILAAPLIAGNDIRSMSATTKAILTNADVVAVNQDPLGKQGTLVATPGSNLQVWSKQLSGTNARAVALFNRSGSAASISVTWSQIGLPAGAATVRDLYAQKDLGTSSDSYTATSVPTHGVVMLKIVSAP
jgi:alpha-galactosidase